MSTVVIMIKQAEKPNIWVSRPCSLTGLWPVNVLFAQTGGIGIKATFGLFDAGSHQRFCDLQRHGGGIDHFHTQFLAYYLGVASHAGAAENDHLGAVLLSGTFCYLQDLCAGAFFIRLDLRHRHAQRAYGC